MKSIAARYSGREHVKRLFAVAESCVSGIVDPPRHPLWSARSSKPQRPGERHRGSPSIAEQVTVMGNRLALRRVVSNLIDNALFYGKNAHVALSPEAGQAVLEIDDEGPGIPLDKRRTI